MYLCDSSSISKQIRRIQSPPHLLINDMHRSNSEAVKWETNRRSTRRPVIILFLDFSALLTLLIWSCGRRFSATQGHLNRSWPLGPAGRRKLEQTRKLPLGQPTPSWWHTHTQRCGAASTLWINIRTVLTVKETQTRTHTVWNFLGLSPASTEDSVDMD